MKVYLVEAWNRKERLDRVMARAKTFAGARTLAQDVDDKKWSHYGNKSVKAARIHYAHSSKPADDTTRRNRLAAVAKAARSGFAAAREGKRGAYDKAAKALHIYQKRRYQPTVLAKRPLTHGGMVHDPSRSVGPKTGTWLRLTNTKKQVPLIVQKQGTKRIHLPHQRMEQPHIAVARIAHNRIMRSKPDVPEPGDLGYHPDLHNKDAVARGKHLDAHKAMAKVGVHKLPPAPVDKTRKLPATATWDPKSKRVSKPVIRRPVVRRDSSALNTYGDHPAATVFKKPLGRKERKNWNRWARPLDTWY